MAQVPANMPPSRPSQQEAEGIAARLNRSDPRNRIYGFKRGVAEEAFRMTQRSHVTPDASPAVSLSPNPDIIDESFAAALPIASGRGEFARTSNFTETMRRYGLTHQVTEAYALLNDRSEAEQLGYDTTSGTYYDPRRYANDAFYPQNDVNGPAALTVRPTSTTNPRRPRTVAAGYDRDRRTLTVVFRDGTFYNYYDVNDATWQAFKAAQSKGQFIKKYLDGHPRGYASMTYLSQKAQELLYRVSRTNQILYQGNQNIRPKRQPRAQNRAYKAGQNPSATASLNPSRNAGRRRNP
jgi:hypothetical protein